MARVGRTFPAHQIRPHVPLIPAAMVYAGMGRVPQGQKAPTTTAVTVEPISQAVVVEPVATAQEMEE